VFLQSLTVVQLVSSSSKALICERRISSDTSDEKRLAKMCAPWANRVCARDRVSHYFRFSHLTWEVVFRVRIYGSLQSYITTSDSWIIEVNGTILIAFISFLTGAHINSANPTRLIYTDLVPRKAAEVTNVMYIFFCYIMREHQFGEWQARSHWPRAS